MSLFQNGLFNSPSSANNTSFHPLFRLLDDFEQHQRNSTDEHPHRQLRTNVKSFTPKFDIKELPEAYELHGDLPGVEQKDVVIEFTDEQTITVRGRTERSYTSGTPTGFIEGSSTPTQAIEGTNSSSEKSQKPAAHKATVQDEDEDNSSTKTNTDSTVSTTSKNTTVSNTNSNKQQEKSEPKAKYWISERSVGEFSRHFTFPVRVDRDNVTAGMKNGVLSITVPKAKKHEAKRIQIWSL